MDKIQEIVRTPEGAFAVFIFLFGGVLVLAMIVAALASREFHNFLSDTLFGGVKCKSCKKRPKHEEWVYWYDKKDKGEKDYRGWVWCPFCDAKRYKGFSDRVF